MTGLLPGSAPELPAPGEDIDHYRIVRELGRGTLGVTYEARDEESGRTVALKLLVPAAPITPEAGQRIRDELDRLASADDPHIAPPAELGGNGDSVFVASQWCAGGSLADRIAGDGVPLPPQTALGIGLDVAEALAAAHAAGVCHGGLTPGNVLLDPDTDRARLGDFGAVLRSQHWTAPPGATAADPCYVAPEVREGGPADERADQYSAAAVLHAAWTGRPPGPTEPGPDESTDPVDAEVREVLDRALDRRPEARFTSAAALAARIRSLIEMERRSARYTPGEEPGALPGTVLQHTLTGLESGAAAEAAEDTSRHRGAGGWWSRWRGGLAGALAVIVLAAAIAFLVWPRDDSSGPQTTAGGLAVPEVTAKPAYRSVRFHLTPGGGAGSAVQVDTGHGWHRARSATVEVPTTAGGEKACLRARTAVGGRHGHAVRACGTSKPRTLRAVRVHPDCLIDGHIRQVCYGLQARGFASGTDPVLTFQVDGRDAGTVTVPIGSDGVGALPDGQHFHFEDADAGKTAKISLDGLTYTWQVAAR